MKVIVIDDREENRYLLETMLKSINYEVEQASNGVEALEKLRSERYDLIISDILMPEMDGFQLCRKVKTDEKLKDIPFVFYTATYTEERDEEFSLKLGVNKFIRKPVEPDKFLKIIEEVMLKTEEGKIKSVEPALKEDEDVFKMYSERLVKKLEKKMLDLEKTEKELRVVNRALKTITGCNHVLIHAQEELNLLNEICRTIVETGGYCRTWVGFPEDDSEKTVRPVAQYGFEEEYFNTVRISWADDDPDHNPIGTSILREHIVVCRDILKNPDYIHCRTEALKNSYTSFIVLPLLSDKNVLGAMNIYSAEPYAFNTEEVKLLTELADDVTFGIVTLRMRAEKKKTKEKIRKLSHVIEQSPISVIITDPKGNIEYVNQRFSLVSGYAFDEAIGKSPCILKSGDTPPAKYKELWETITSGGEWRGEFHNKKKNGELFWESEIISSIKNSKDEITHFIGVKEDITERKQMGQMLVQSQKMESMGRLAGGIAHDFNNILTSIMGYAEFLKIKFNDTSSEEGKAADIILNGAERASDLTKQLLGFARAGKYNIVPLKFNEVIKEAVKVTEKIFEKKVEIEYDFTEDINTIDADRNQMNQVLTNIIINANDAMPDGGKLIFKTENMYLDKDYTKRYSELEQGNYVKISITDTGTGMPADIRDKIFEPFFTTKGQDKGTGLGLATVYGIIKNHKGHINCCSEVGEGTTFILYFPVSENVISENRKENDIVRGNELILVIDDEENVRNIVQKQLELIGYKVMLASCRVKAIEIYKTNTEKIDLVILDLVMPGLTVKEILYELKRINPDVKILATSGFSHSDKVSEIINQVNGFIQKPFKLYEISRAICNALRNIDGSFSNPIK